MKLKSIINSLAIATLIAGMGATAIETSASEATTTTVKKKVTRKKAASTTTVSLANKTYKGTYYGPREENWEVYFQPGFVCHIKTDDTTYQGTYKVKGNKVTITYWGGAETTMTFDIKSKGAKLYYEETTPRHAFECELDLVK